jgi:hypothetical protein
MPDVRDEYATLQKLWDVYCASHAEAGLDMRQVWAVWAQQIRDSLKEWAADRSFDELCTNGCQPLPLAITIAIIRPLEDFESTWRETTGSNRRKEQTIRSLERAADALENLQRSLADTVVAQRPISFDAHIAEWLRKEIVNPSNLDAIWPKSAIHPHPATVVRALRLYAKVLRAFQDLSEETKIASTNTLCRYLISAYVKRATGSFHDPEVSTLIGGALKVIYDETAHRVWRARNYSQIDEGLGFLADLLIGLGVVATKGA